MRAAGLASFGPPDVLHVMEVPEPHAGSGQVRIKVAAASVNPIDWKLRAGYMSGGEPLDAPKRLGNDASGVVDEVGAGVATVRPGEEVLGFCRLTAYAEYVVVPADAVTAKPASMPWDVAGGFPAGAASGPVVPSSSASCRCNSGSRDRSAWSSLGRVWRASRNAARRTSGSASSARRRRADCTAGSSSSPRR